MAIIVVDRLCFASLVWGGVAASRCRRFVHEPYHLGR
jgi:hypothetical protein